MVSYPYSTATGTIQAILAKIQNVGQPSKVDSKWLSSIGFSKPSEQRIISIFKFLNFIDSVGIPTDNWKQFRSIKNGKSVLGVAIKEAYSELYNTYSNAHEIKKDELTDFFKTRTDAGNLALSHTVNTFKNLADFAEFKENTEVILAKIEQQPAESPLLPSQDNVPEKLSKKFQTSHGVTVNLNIQLTVPDTLDEKVYDKFFESMKKHLLS